MSTELATHFSHVRPQDTSYEDQGLRDFFLYRDLGIAGATDGKVLAQLVKANHAPEQGTGWHRHEADFHIVIMLKGWARFMYGDKETLVAAGDCVHQAPGIVHYLFDYSEDMEYIEIVSPANFKSIDVEGPCEVPAVHAVEERDYLRPKRDAARARACAPPVLQPACRSRCAAASAYALARSTAA